MASFLAWILALHRNPPFFGVNAIKKSSPIQTKTPFLQPCDLVVDSDACPKIPIFLEKTHLGLQKIARKKKSAPNVASQNPQVQPRLTEFLDLTPFPQAQGNLQNNKRNKKLGPRQPGRVKMSRCVEKVQLGVANGD